MSEKTLGESEEQSEIPERPRQRFRPLIVMSAIVLIGLIIAGGVFTSHQLTGTGSVLGPTPTATTVSWTGTNWQVALDHSTGIERTTITNPVCDAAQYLFADDARFNSVAGSSQNMYWKFVSGSNPAAGCVAEAFAETTAGTLSSHPLASCLYRFGVPLALDSEAHRSWPFLLQASPYEQRIAQQIVAQAHTA